MGRTGAAMVLAALVLAGCGGDDGDGDDDATGGEAAGGEAASGGGGTGGELAAGDPCELVTADDVAAVAGFSVTAELVNVDDGLDGATCLYTGEAGEGALNLSIGPDAGGLFDASAESDLAEDGPDIGDASYLVPDGEIGVRVGDTVVRVSVFVSDLSLEDEGAELARLAVDALGAA